MRFANVAWELRDPGGQVLGAGLDPNLTTDGMRSAFAIAMASAQVFAAADTARVPNFWVWGTGTAIPLAVDTALQYPVTSKKTGDSVASGTSGFTARLFQTLGHIEQTGTLTEIGLMHKPHASGTNHLFARALLNGGTGINHASGTVAVFSWDLVLSTGVHTV